MPQLFQNPFERKSREEVFWEWFANNSDRIRVAETGQEEVLHALYAQLNKVQKGLTFELGPVSDEQREFIVSADGIRERFPAVQKLVTAAPQFPDWKIIAFRQPKGLGGRIQIGEIDLSQEDLWFSAHAEGNLTSLKIYIRGLNDQNMRDFAEAAFILLDAVLGEYVLETRVGSIEWESLPDDPVGRGLMQLKDLPNAIETGARKHENQG